MKNSDNKIKNYDLEKLTEIFKLKISDELDDNMSFQTYFKNSELVCILENTVYVYIPLKIIKLFKLVKQKYSTQIGNVIKSLFDGKYKFEIINDKTKYSSDYSLDNYDNYNKTDPQMKVAVNNPKNKDLATLTLGPTDDFNLDAKTNQFNLNQTFQNFVECDFNTEITSVFKKICNNEFPNINLVYFWSESGCGKTHLLNAVGNALSQNGKNGIFVDSASFSLEIASLLKENNQTKISNIIKYYQELDFVLFDDFQTYGDGKKKATKSLIFNIIDGRIRKNKLTVVASVYDSQTLNTIFDNRFISRFTAGFNSKIHFLKENDLYRVLDYLLSNKFYPELFDDEIKEFIVRNHSDSVGSLVGAVNRLEIYESRIKNSENINETIKEIFKGLVRDTQNIKPDMVVKTVAKYYNVSTKDIMSRTRKGPIVVARHVIMYLLSDVLKMSSNEIGKFFERDHSTVLNALNKFKTDDPDGQNIKTVEFLRKKLFGIN
ncbi:helix-turn-helix domain-containing protein [Mycoplasma corogypsi]|uniref:helix-turn-helix domain-containing protein n=1 Tax=Mycoplasma corogypsi TaxID=2106 RepID=UPI0038738071